MYNPDEDEIVLSEKLVEIFSQKQPRTLKEFSEFIEPEDRSLFSEEMLNKIEDKEIIFRLNGKSSTRFFSSTIKKHISSVRLILGHPSEIIESINRYGNYETFFKNGQTANCILNLTGDILVVNKKFKKIFENSTEDLRTKSIFNISVNLSKELLSKSFQNYENLKKPTEARLFDLKLRTNNNSILWGKYNFSKIFD